MTKIVGVDDAGRGCIIGPLVIAGVCVDGSDVSRLADLGVRDSKTLTPRARETLYPEIKKISTISIRKVPPIEVDEYVLKGKKLRKLNYLEALTMASVISELRPDVAYVDASDTNPKRFGSQISDAIKTKVKIVSSHKADSRYPVVSAASIIAKVSRDREIKKIEEQYGHIGSGYPSDEKTISFLRKWLLSDKGAPPFARLSWKTWKSIRETTLDHY
ncbi:MAG: ribonuclease HII [Thaumarchaeota archaeon]|nr:ribonuclease HII [Nitrososphaerota archaeon]